MSKHPKSGFVAANAVVFGGAGCSSVWRRGSAYLGRSGQSLFSEDELRMEIFVDDPCCPVRGPAHLAKRRGLVLLMW